MNRNSTMSSSRHRAARRLTAAAVLLCATSSGAWAQNPSNATNQAIQDAVQERRDQIQRTLEQWEEQLRRDRAARDQITEDRSKEGQVPAEPKRQ
jgi:septal ring factor EnvC (AmiA/AmiB activator)